MSAASASPSMVICSESSGLKRSVSPVIRVIAPALEGIKSTARRASGTLARTNLMSSENRRRRAAAVSGEIP